MSRGFIWVLGIESEAVRGMREKEKKERRWCGLFTCVGSEGERVVNDGVNGGLG
jgi:hypothetical protein